MGIVKVGGTVKTSNKLDEVKTVSQRSLAGDKASLEDAIASANMEYYKTNLTTLLNSPTIIIDLLPINKDHSSFRSGIHDVASADRGGLKFNLIRNFVAYHEPVNLISDTSKDENKNVVVNTTTQTFIVLPTVEPPLPGSRLVRKFENKSVVYEVINSEPITYQDHPFFRVTYTVDSIFKDKSELIPLIIDTFTFKLENVGSGNNAVLKDDISEIIESLKEVVIELDSNYGEAFYNSRYDNVVYIDRNGEGASKAVYTCPAMALFQSKYGPLSFRLVNTLMLLPARKLPKEKIDYTRSLYSKITKRALPEGYVIPPIGRPKPKRTLINIVDEAVEYNEYDNEDFDYGVMYDYRFDLISVTDRKDKVLTPFRSLSEELNHIRFMSTDAGPLYESRVQYAPTNKRVLRVIDSYISNDTEIADVFESMRGFEVDEDNFDHFMMLPLVILFIKEYIGTLISKEQKGEWS